MKPILRHILSLAACFLLSAPSADAQFYYGLSQTFGKNRVQYQDLQWSYYRLPGYDVYYYRKSREVAQYVAEFAGKEIKSLEKYLDFPLDDRLEFVVYNTNTHLKQSNVNAPSEDEYNTGGQSKIVGSKVFLYFNGDYRDLQRQIKAGLVQVIVDQMMYGGNLRDVIRSSTFINLPDWYLNGLVSYLSDPNSAEIRNRVNDGIQSGRFEKFKILNQEELTAAGHSIWEYIGYTYGEGVIPQILYMTRINNNIESGFNFILGTDLKGLSAAWLNFYKNQLMKVEASLPNGQELNIKAPKEAKVSQFKLNPDRDMIAYVSNTMGQYKVYLKDLNVEGRERIHKGGYAIDGNPDYSYPLLAWHPSGRVLAMVTEEEGSVQLKVRDIDDELWVLERPVFHIDKINSMEYSSDGKKLLIAGMKGGQSDIFEYSVLSNTFKQITKDVYDDFDPVYLNGDRFIAFASTRPGDSLNGDGSDTLEAMSHTDLFIYRKSDKKALWRLTSTEGVDEMSLDRLSSTSFIYLEEINGNRHRNVLLVDSAIAYVDTITHYRYVSRRLNQSNYSVSILEHDVDPKLGSLAELFYFNGGYQLMLNRIVDLDGLGEVKPQSKPIKVEKPKDTTEVDVPVEQEVYKADTLIFEKPKENKIRKDFDLDDYVFHPDLIKTEPKPKKPEPIQQPEPAADLAAIEANTEPPFELPSPKNYIRAFFTDYFVSQLDNSFLDESYQPFSGGGPLYLNPSFNGLIKLGVGDLFEDYKIVGAIRLSTSFENAEYYFSLKNVKKRWDHVYNFNRKSLVNVSNFGEVQKVLIHSLEYETKYPFSEVAAIKGSIGGRYDHNITLATDNVSLNEPDSYTAWLQVGAQYVFDNTIPTGINLYNGLRYKAFYEYYQNVQSFDQGMHVIGFDIRHYQKIHRSFIWANRFAGSTSRGQQKLIYFMGGVDSWFTPSYNQETPISTKHNYAFQTLATNMRGFIQNARNGNSFFVYNSELRMPVFKYLLNRPVKSDFVKNFQVVSFLDVGSAWTGATPYSKGNALNNTIIKNGAITIQLDKQREPIIYGYGFGVRSKVLGYFVRLDWAWGVEDQITLPRVFYLSLSQDF